MLSTDANRASLRAGSDIELWLALHDECYPEGCGTCVGIDLEIQEETMQIINLAAHITGQSVDAFIVEAIITAAEDVLVGS